jgi:hypothetical protein
MKTFVIIFRQGPRELTESDKQRRAEETVTALLFLEAHDLSEATQVAEAHPALRYGSEVEVRPWAPPVPAATATATSR